MIHKESYRYLQTAGGDMACSKESRLFTLISGQMYASPLPLTCIKPRLIVDEPLGRPGKNCLGQIHVPAPFVVPGKVEAKHHVFVDVRRTFFATALEFWLDHVNTGALL